MYSKNDKVKQLRDQLQAEQRIHSVLLDEIQRLKKELNRLDGVLDTFTGMGDQV